MEQLLQDCFLTVLNMSITSSFVIAGVLIARLLLRRAPKIFSYVLWAVVLFRLVCPFSFETVLSLVPVSPQTVPPAIVYSPVPQIDSGIAAVDSVINQALTQTVPPPETGDSVNPMQVLVFAAAVTWAAVAGVLLAYSLISCLLLRKQVSRAMRIDNDIYECESVSSPFVLGLFHPKIYLPMGVYDDRYTYIVSHEQTHIRRRDHLVKPLAYLVLCLHWFNPLCWLAYLLMCRDMEMSCDEAVVLRLGGRVRKDYSETLLALAGSRVLLSGGPLAFGESGVGSRIKNILKFRKPTAALMSVGVMVVLAMGCGLIANPKSEEKAPPDSSDPPQSQSAPNLPALSDSEAKTVAEGLIERGVGVGWIFSEAFQLLPADPATPGKQAFDYERQSAPELLALVQKLRSVDDIKAYVYDTFDDETAEKILSFSFNNRYELYYDGEAGVLVNTGIGPTNLMMAEWRPETMTVVSAEPDRIVAEMEIEQFNSLPEAGTERRELTILSDGAGGWRLTGDYIIDRELKLQPPPGAPFTAIENGRVNYQEVLRLYGAIDSQREDGTTVIKPTAVSLYYSDESWGPDAPLDTNDYFSWFYSTTAKEEYEYKLEAYKSPLGADKGMFFPQDLYEGRIQQYFDVSAELLRQHDWYHADLGGYQIETGPGKGETPRIAVDMVDEEGDLRHIHALVLYDGGRTDKLTLTIRVAADDTFKFVGGVWAGE